MTAARPGRARGREVLLWGGGLVLALGLVGLAAWGWWTGFESLREAREELDHWQARRSALEEANRKLRRELAGLRHDREAKARAAREMLNVAAAGEVVVLLPPPTPTAPRSR